MNNPYFKLYWKKINSPSNDYGISRAIFLNSRENNENILKASEQSENIGELEKRV